MAVVQVSHTWAVTETYYYLAPSPLTGLRRPFEMEIVRAQDLAPLSTGDRYWYEADGLDSIVALTDETGDLASPYLYDEYGRHLAGTTDLQLFTYTAQDYDPETGLIHFYARYYDPARGVWLTQDTQRGFLQNPLTIHRYVYAVNRPISWIDVQGHFPWLVAIPIVVGVVVAGGILYAALTDDTPPAPPEERSIASKITGYDAIKEARDTFNRPDATTKDKIGAGARIVGHTVKNGIIAGVATYGLEHCVLAGYEFLTSAGTAACADGDCTNEVNTGTNVVYQYVQNGVPRYIGITNDFLRRAGEHLRTRGWEIQRIRGLEHLSRFDARAVEQVLIEHYGLTNLYNRINSIAASNPVYQEAIRRGTEILRHIGILE